MNASMSRRRLLGLASAGAAIQRNLARGADATPPAARCVWRCASTPCFWTCPLKIAPPK
jgi:hypothetical protein